MRDVSFRKLFADFHVSGCKLVKGFSFWQVRPVCTNFRVSKKRSNARRRTHTEKGTKTQMHVKFSCHPPSFMELWSTKDLSGRS